MDADSYMDAEQKRRYVRQIAVPEIGADGQAKLIRAKVFIVGCGALGSMVAMQLAAAGIGEIHIADFDTIDLSNLQRQLFFTSSRCGESKSATLAERMKALNPEVNVVEHREMVTEKRAGELFVGCDFIIDGSDNPETKYMTERVCSTLCKSYCIAGVSGFSGQVLTCVPGSTCFGEIVPEGAGGGLLPCSIAGVIGPAAAIAASIQASEAIKYITGVGKLLTDSLLTFNLLENSFKVINC